MNYRQKLFEGANRSHARDHATVAGNAQFSARSFSVEIVTTIFAEHRGKRWSEHILAKETIPKAETS